MDLRQAFLDDHAHLHSAVISGAGLSMEDNLCQGLSADQLRARPLGLNSIAWLLWHVTRFEDVVVNVVLQDRPDVLAREGWATRLGVETRQIGTGSSDAEVDDFGQRVDPEALRAYRAAVGRATRAWAAEADWSALDAVPDVAGRLARAPATIGERAAWVQALWSSRSGHGMLALPVIGHSYLHVGEARVTRARLGARVP